VKGDCKMADIKKALDDFTEEEFIDSKQEIKKEIHQKVKDYLQKKLGLEKDYEEGTSQNEE
jgi:hypothetical protein